jgi:hypothetical protein
MPFDSEGNFTRKHNWEQDRINEIEIMSDRHDEEDDNFAAGLSVCVVKDGRSVMTGDLKMGGYQIKNVANATASTDAVNKGQLDAIDSGAVHKTGDESIYGNKSFHNSISSVVSYLTTAYATNLTATNVAVTDHLNIPGGSIWIA